MKKIFGVFLTVIVVIAIGVLINPTTSSAGEMGQKMQQQGSPGHGVPAMPNRDWNPSGGQVAGNDGIILVRGHNPQVNGCIIDGKIQFVYRTGQVLNPPQFQIVITNNNPNSHDPRCEPGTALFNKAREHVLGLMKNPIVPCGANMCEVKKFRP